MKIGVLIDSLRLGFDEGLRAAAELKADGVQFFTTRGALHPGKLDAKGRAGLRRRLGDLGLGLAALCGDFGGHGFARAAENPKRIDDSKRVMDLALDLGTRVVTTHIGVVPAAKSAPRYAVMAKACEELARYGESVGAVFAVETGPEPAAVLRAFLDDSGAGRGLGVNFDPANLVMVINEDPAAAVRTLGPYIVHTHAKDGVNLKPVDAEKLYAVFAGDKIPGFVWTDFMDERPLGEGKVPWPEYIEALRAEKFDGYLTIEREAGEDRRGDVARGIEFLRKLLG